MSCVLDFLLEGAPIHAKSSSVWETATSFNEFSYILLYGQKKPFNLISSQTENIPKVTFLKLILFLKDTTGTVVFLLK